MIVGFTFLMALTRFETRREAVLNEANAIGTTALRARLLPEPHRTGIAKATSGICADTDRLHPDGQVFCGTTELLLIVPNNIQGALWQQVKALSAKDNNMVPTGLFIQALNEMIDDQGKRLSAPAKLYGSGRCVAISLFRDSCCCLRLCGLCESGLDPLRDSTACLHYRFSSLWRHICNT